MCKAVYQQVCPRRRLASWGFPAFLCALYWKWDCSVDSPSSLLYAHPSPRFRKTGFRRIVLLGSPLHGAGIRAMVRVREVVGAGVEEDRRSAGARGHPPGLAVPLSTLSTWFVVLCGRLCSLGDAREFSCADGANSGPADGVGVSQPRARAAHHLRRLLIPRVNSALPQTEGGDSAAP